MKKMMSGYGINSNITFLICTKAYASESNVLTFIFININTRTLFKLQYLILLTTNFGS